MRRRLFAFFVVLFCIFGMLLLLSALLVTPEAEEIISEESSAAHTITAFVSMPPSTTTVSTAPANVGLRVAALFTIMALMLPCSLCICDANGRVLRQKRYVRSFFLVFKQEYACG